MATQRAGRAVLAPNLGLYYDRPSVLVPERGVQAPSKNFRIANGEILSDNLGWGQFPGNGETQVNLEDKPVLLIQQFQKRGGTIQTVLGNTTDLFEYESSSNTLSYLTPRVESGTVDVQNGSATVNGNGTNWNTAGHADQLKVGDFIHVGATGQTSLTATWYEIQAVVSDTEITLTETYNEANDTAVAYTARSVFQGALDRPYYTEPFYGGENHSSGSDGDRLYITNGIDAIVAWDGDTDQVYRPDLGTIDTCTYLKRFKNIMIYVAPTISGELRSFAISTSAIGQPENISTLEASAFTVNDDTDPLTSAEQIGEQLALYSRQSITLAQFVGSPLIFAFRTAVSEYGPRSARAVQVFSDHHLYIADDGMYRFDGVAARPFNNHVWREVVRQIDPGKLELIQSHIDDSRGDALWVVPDTGADFPANAYTTHYLEDTGDERNPQPHSYRELPATAIGSYLREDALTFDQLTEAWTEYNFQWNDRFFQATFPLTLFGDNDGNVWILNDKHSKDGTALPVTVRFSRRPAIDNRTRGVVKRVYPMLSDLAGLSHSVTVNVRAFDSEAGAVQQTDTGTFAVDESSRTTDFVAFRTPCLFYEVEFATTGVQEPFFLAGYDADATRAGERGRR